MAQRRYVSIKEVAATAGVSFQTASKVLNGGDVRVSAETAARIVAAAERLGYQPNTIARGLVQRTTATIGLVASDATDWRSRRLRWRPSRRAQARPRGAVGHLPRAGATRPHRAHLIERRVDGIIAAAPDLEENGRSASCCAYTCPRSACSRYRVAGCRWSVPTTGRPAAGDRAPDRAGPQAIGTITGPFRRRVTRSRLHGYEDALRQAGIEPARAGRRGRLDAAGPRATRPCWSGGRSLRAFRAQRHDGNGGAVRPVPGGAPGPAEWRWSAATTSRSPSSWRRR